MKVVFDYQVFYLQKYGGISRYFYELANELNQLDGCEPMIVAPFHQNAYLKNNKDKNFILSFNPLFEKAAHNRFYDKRIAINKWVSKKRYAAKKNTILHETYYTQRFDLKLPVVITIHDMIPELIQNRAGGENNIIESKKQAIAKAQHIIAVSESTKKDLLKLYPSAEHKTSVVHHGIHKVDADNLQAYQHSRPYILFVGNRDWYKNFNVLIKVYSENAEIHQNFDVICFGGGAFTADENALIGTYKNNVKYLSGNDDLLNALYKGAAVLAYLSGYEGFGLPVLEAMQLGCPVICSNGSSLPEVAGDCAQLVDVADHHAINKALVDVLFNPQQFKDMILRGQQRAAQFTWKKCAIDTLKIYNQVMAHD